MRKYKANATASSRQNLQGKELYQPENLGYYIRTIKPFLVHYLI